MPADEQLLATFKAFDAANSEDPNSEIIDGVAFPKELLYGQRMSHCLEQFAPNSSTALQLAARSQHIKRWCSPRSDYPEGLQGYRQWRTALRRFHATTAHQIMLEYGYDQTSCERVESLLMKKALKTDAETQTLEDVICIVFLEYYFQDFAAKHSEAKLIDIIQKTWKKMSEQGHQAALKIDFPAPLLALVQKALS